MAMALQDVLIDELSELYALEERQPEILSMLIEVSADADLQQFFEATHRDYRWQQDRLTNIFEMLEEERRDLPMESLEGFVTDTQARIGVDVDIELVDLAIIAAACRIENMEVAGYETRREVALALDLKESAKLLEEMIRGEQDAYRRLAQLAKPILKSAAEADDDLEAERWMKEPISSAWRETKLPNHPHNRATCAATF